MAKAWDDPRDTREGMRAADSMHEMAPTMKHPRRFGQLPNLAVPDTVDDSLPDTRKLVHGKVIHLLSFSVCHPATRWLNVTVTEMQDGCCGVRLGGSATVGLSRGIRGWCRVTPRRAASVPRRGSGRLYTRPRSIRSHSAPAIFIVIAWTLRQGAVALVDIAKARGSDASPLETFETLASC